ncbi:MAG: transporter substrate-binding domain-containing protein [Putridiphycobacter sp.]|nr:transporter substrate-binding domain-containing protein [Putridiphycobacter sp.]
MSRLLIITFILSSLLSCEQPIFKIKNTEVVDWEHIKKEKVLTILAENGPASFFIVKGKNMGYEYELLHEFAKDNDIRLKIKMVQNLDSIFTQLYDFEGDVIACNLTVTPERKKLVRFTTPHLISHQVLVQRNPVKKAKNDSTATDVLITEIEQLKGKTVTVWNNSTHRQQLEKLNETLKLNLTIVPLEGDITTEEIIRMVSEGQLDYTIADENIAKINQIYWSNLNIDLKLSSDESIAFAVRLSSPKLQKKLNSWLNDRKNRSTIGEVKRKYFERRNLARKANSAFSSASGNQLSPYDNIIKEEAKNIGWDWRLISSVIYQESKFETYKTSWAGAFGIFQFMPATAAAYGINENSSAEAQIKAGIRKLDKNYKQWLLVLDDSLEAIHFTLATFNAGRAHVDDARALAGFFGKDSSKWFGHVDSMILGLSKPKYYKHKVVKYGYMRGLQTFEYIYEVMERYEEYRHAFPE